MTKACRGEQTRTDIMQTAARMFALQGYFHTSTADILDGAAISKGAFYHHFNSKEELVRAVLEQLRLDYRQQVIEPVLGVAPERRLAEMLDLVVSLNQSGQWSGCLLLTRLIAETAQQESDLSRQVTEIVEMLIGFWRDIILDARAADAIDKKFDPPHLAELIFTTLYGGVACRELFDTPVRLPRIAVTLKELLDLPLSRKDD